MILVNPIHRVTILVAGLILAACGSGQQITQEQAKSLASIALANYAKGRLVNIDTFGPPNIMYNENGRVWEFYYETTTQPKHRVNILVDNFKRTETHTLPEN